MNGPPVSPQNNNQTGRYAARFSSARSIRPGS